MLVWIPLPLILPRRAPPRPALPRPGHKWCILAALPSLYLVYLTIYFHGRLLFICDQRRVRGASCGFEKDGKGRWQGRAGRSRSSLRRGPDGLGGVGEYGRRDGDVWCAARWVGGWVGGRSGE